MSEEILNTTITIKLSFKFGKKKKNERQSISMNQQPLDSTTIVAKTLDARKNIFGFDPCWCKNARPQNTNITNVITKIQGKSAKIVRTRGFGVKPKFVRLIIEQI